MGVLLWLGGLLLVSWLVAWLAFEIASGVVHLLLLAAAALLLWGIVKRSPAV